IIVDNSYSAATGGQELLSSRADSAFRNTRNSIERAVRGIGTNWVRLLTDTYKISKMKDTLLSAIRVRQAGPKVIIAQSECMLNKQRRIRPLTAAAINQ